MTTDLTVRKILRDHLAFDEDREVVDTLRLHEDMAADSLDMVELEMAFEEEFGIDICDDEADKFEKLETVGEVVAYIQGRVDS